MLQPVEQAAPTQMPNTVMVGRPRLIIVHLLLQPNNILQLLRRHLQKNPNYGDSAVNSSFGRLPRFAGLSARPDLLSSGACHRQGPGAIASVFGLS